MTKFFPEKCTHILPCTPVTNSCLFGYKNNVLGNLSVESLSVFLPNRQAKWEVREEVSCFKSPVAPSEEAVVNSSTWIQEADGLDLNPGLPLNHWISWDKVCLSSETQFPHL